MSEQCALGFVGSVRRNLTNLICTNVLGLRLFPSQFSNSVDRGDCRKSFYGVFLRYLELSMSERRVLGVIGTVRGNLMNLIYTNMLGLRLVPSQF